MRLTRSLLVLALLMRYRPIERMLLGSIVGLAICTLWIWISARAGR